MNDDYMLKIAESVGAAAAKLFFKKQKNDFENISISEMGEGDIFSLVLQRLAVEGKYNEAENLLFEKLKESSSEEMLKAGERFYNSLLKVSDDELLKGNFSREEIYQGLEDLKKLNNK